MIISTCYSRERFLDAWMDSNSWLRNMPRPPSVRIGSGQRLTAFVSKVPPFYFNFNLCASFPALRTISFIILIFIVIHLKKHLRIGVDAHKKKVIFTQWLNMTFFRTVCRNGGRKRRWVESKLKRYWIFLGAGWNLLNISGIFKTKGATPGGCLYHCLQPGLYRGKFFPGLCKKQERQYR